MPKNLILLSFLVLVVGGGLLVGLVAMPGVWYDGLEKPPFNPPNWIFGPVWTLLYVLIAIAGSRVWLANRRSALMAAWWVQLVLNFAWSPVFFGLHQIGAAFLVITALLVTIAAFMSEAWNRDRLTAMLFAPYFVWVAFASVLNASIWWLNA